VRADAVAEQVIAGFVGSACVRVRRNRGSPTFVVPFTDLGKDNLKSWLGFQEKWELVSAKIYSFHHVSLTVHFGYEGDIAKPQMFRAEWPGIRRWTSEKIGFQSPGAGHPHWQFDALESTLNGDAEIRERTLARIRGDEVVADFQPESSHLNAISAAQKVSIERFHFASAAPWWQPNAYVHPSHMNAPADADAISRWVLECVSYMRQELDRCRR
jgi:hypothetical protein